MARAPYLNPAGGADTMPPKLDLGVARRYALSRGGKCLALGYPSDGASLPWKCALGHEWRARLEIMRRRGGWCRRCASAAPRVLEGARYLAAARGGACLSEAYVSDEAPLLWRCALGHEFRASLEEVEEVEEVLWCPRCSGRARIGLGLARGAAAARGGECLSAAYSRCAEPLQWRCAAGHEWEASLWRVKNENVWCGACDAPPAAEAGPAPAALAGPGAPEPLAPSELSAFGAKIAPAPAAGLDAPGPRVFSGASASASAFPEGGPQGPSAEEPPPAERGSPGPQASPVPGGGPQPSTESSPPPAAEAFAPPRAARAWYQACAPPGQTRPPSRALPGQGWSPASAPPLPTRMPEMPPLHTWAGPRSWELAALAARPVRTAGEPLPPKGPARGSEGETPTAPKRGLAPAGAPSPAGVAFDPLSGERTLPLAAVPGRTELAEGDERPPALRERSPATPPRADPEGLLVWRCSRGHEWAEGFEDQYRRATARNYGCPGCPSAKRRRLAC
jgi:hypothetical protein